MSRRSTKSDGSRTEKICDSNNIKSVYKEKTKLSYSDQYSDDKNRRIRLIKVKSNQNIFDQIGLYKHF